MKLPSPDTYDGEELLFIPLNINEPLSEVPSVTFNIFPASLTHHDVSLPFCVCLFSQIPLMEQTS